MSSNRTYRGNRWELYWTKEDIEKVKKYRSEGFCQADIAGFMQCSTPRIQKVCRLLKLNQRMNKGNIRGERNINSQV